MARPSAAALLVSAACGGGTTDPPPTDTTDPTPAPLIPPGPYVPGRSYFGRNDYIEYVAGNAPLIYTAPHGGALTPSDIPDRTASRCGGSATTATDLNTRSRRARCSSATSHGSGRIRTSSSTTSHDESSTPIDCRLKRRALTRRHSAP